MTRGAILGNIFTLWVFFCICPTNNRITTATERLTVVSGTKRLRGACHTKVSDFATLSRDVTPRAVQQPDEQMFEALCCAIHENTRSTDGSTLQVALADRQSLTGLFAHTLTELSSLSALMGIPTLGHMMGTFKWERERERKRERKSPRYLPREYVWKLTWEFHVTNCKILI